ncbi:MAG TPA: peptidoglycan-binding protein [Candidatus Paceibacterota bacterium]
MKTYSFALSIIAASLAGAALVSIPSDANAAGTISIGVISPNDVVPTGTAVTFQVSSADFPGVPSYTVSDSFPGSSVSNALISKSGYFNWTPGPDDIGTHVLTISAFDAYNNRHTITRTVRVTEASMVSIRNLAPGPVVAPDTAVTFSVAALGYANPSYWVSDSFYGSTLSSRNIDSYGNFSWTPKKSDAGVHGLSVRVTNSSGRTDTVYQTVTVKGINLRSISSRSVTVGSTMTFGIDTFGMTLPSFRLTDSSPNNTISNATVVGSDFSWTPQAQDIGTHTITVNATDIHGAFHSTSFTVTVSPVSTVIQTPSQPAQPAAPAKYVFRTALNVGSKGAEVSELQKRLKADGYFSGPVTGTYGPLTKAAVQKFQKANRLQQLGNVGPGTRAALNK